MSSDALYSGEAQLAGWSDSHTGGVKVVLWLPDPAALEPFRSMTVRKGNTAGQVMMVAMVEVGDDGKPVRQPTPPQRLSQVAALLCSNPQFWEWWAEAYGFWPTDADQCARLMRTELGIDSRADLDTDDDAALLFHERMRRPFVAWQANG